MAHIPVLLNEVLESLELKSGKFVIDGTTGSGGHSMAIMKLLQPDGIFLGLDWDEEMIKKIEEKFRNEKAKLKKIILRHANYADLPEILKEEKLSLADGLLLDLGFSSEQLKAKKGFSITHDQPLVMTYSKDQPPAYQVLRQLSKEELGEIIRNYGEERYARKIAKAIWEQERKEPITTSGELRRVIRQAVPKSYERGRIDPATRTFMAFRIYLNDELGNLEKILRAIPGVMAEGGRVAVISFHSLEDRLVKNRFRELKQEGKARLVTKKPIRPAEDELKNNPRSRSAKLRVIEMTQ